MWSRLCHVKSVVYGIMIVVIAFFLVHKLIKNRFNSKRPRASALDQVPPFLYEIDESKSNYAATITKNDVLITVKTTKSNHLTRVGIILKTWWKSSEDQIFFVTDEVDEATRDATNHHLVASNCDRSHSRTDLCCKTGHEFDLFYQRRERWWCRFDDDNYVNIDRLVELLRTFNDDLPVLIGRRSRMQPTTKFGIKFYFPTGGAGVCLSRPLADLIETWFRKNKMDAECRNAKVTEDMLFGYVINGKLNIPLHESLLFHSHLETLKKSMSHVKLKQQVSFSYKEQNVTPFNDVRPAFNHSEDPTRFFSIHCLLFPADHICDGS